MIRQSLRKQIISIVTPAYNEEAVLPMFCQALISQINLMSKYSFEIIVVENGSADRSIDVLLKERKKDKRIKILQLVRNVGVDDGILAGLSYASGNAAIVMNADLQDDPRLIPQFIKNWENGYDMVYAIILARMGHSRFHQLILRVLYKTMHGISGGIIYENVSDYRLIDRRIYHQIIQSHEHNVFFRALVSLTSSKSIGIPYDRPARAGGISKMTPGILASDIYNALYTFPFVPNRIIWILVAFSFLVVFLSFFLSTYREGILIILFMLLIILALASEYLARILDEVRDRPLFLVKKTYGLSKSVSKTF